MNKLRKAFVAAMCVAGVSCVFIISVEVLLIVSAIIAGRL